MPISMHEVTIVTFAAVLGLAAVCDLRSFRIPNRYSLALAALYPVHVLSAPWAVDWLAAVILAVTVLGVGFVLFSFRLFGGGDAKLMAVVALWAGPVLIVPVLLLTAVTGGLMAVFMKSWMRFGVAFGLQRIGMNRAVDALIGDTLPYGPAIVVGGFHVAWSLLLR